MFPQLSSYFGLEHQNSIPPSGTCIAIWDQDHQPVPRPQGSFIQLHLLSLYLRQKHPCVFFSTSECFNHVKVISAKCGFGVQSYVDSGLLHYVSALTTEVASPPKTSHDIQLGMPGNTLRSLLASLTKSVDDLRSRFPDKAPCLVLEDVSVFVDIGVDFHDLFVFLHDLRKLVFDGCFVLYGTSTVGDRDEDPLRFFFFHFGEWFVETSGLRSGLSSTIDGQLDVRMRNGKRPGQSTKMCHYKVQDRRIQFFAPGTSSGVL